MTKLYDCLVADLFQNGAKYNPEIRALSHAVLQEKRRIIDWADKTRTMAMIDELPEIILDVLAVELRTPAYDEGFPIETKRDLVKGTLTFYKLLGTPEVVNWVIRSIFGNSEVEEWFNYGGNPYTFRVSIDAVGQSVDADLYRRVLAMIDYCKNLRSHLDGITIADTAIPSPTLYTAGHFATWTTTVLPVLEVQITYLTDENGMILTDETGAILIDAEEG